MLTPAKVTVPGITSIILSKAFYAPTLHLAFYLISANIFSFYSTQSINMKPLRSQNTREPITFPSSAELSNVENMYVCSLHNRLCRSDQPFPSAPLSALYRYILVYCVTYVVHCLLELFFISCFVFSTNLCFRPSFHAIEFVVSC